MRISSKFFSSFSLISTSSLLLLSLFPSSFFFPLERTFLLRIEPKSSSTGLGFGLGGWTTLGLGGLITRVGIGGGIGIFGPPFTGAIAGITGGFTTGTFGIVFGIGGALGILLFEGISGAFGIVFGIGGAIGMLLEGIDGGWGIFDGGWGMFDGGWGMFDWGWELFIWGWFEFWEFWGFWLFDFSLSVFFPKITPTIASSPSSCSFKSFPIISFGWSLKNFDNPI